ncbi:glycosyltransferase family 4 protein [Pontibaca salina]|uniref:Glycosyltransferase family 4 protein n=1 Tax=Pontibaca salina TaxID=2795731 RepID=A0A934M240_9RHOB|nr:glycosyltransferase family 4 protein [Pontibaca salina]MBI6630266.1 glycosyltransferase family 4 protein [Pontibaca salina]
MRLLMILSGDANKASSRVRGYWVAEALCDRGHTVALCSPSARHHYLPLLGPISKSDVVIFQKMYGRYDIVLARLCRALGKSVYFDIDDAPSRIQSDRTIGNAATMMRLSHGVFAGSRALVAYAKESQPATHLVPSGIRLGNYRLKSHDAHRPVCLGWIGNGAHYADDLIDVLAGPLTRLASQHPLRFRLVGACGVKHLYDVFGTIDGLEFDFVDQLDWSDPDAISEAVAPFDIGLYPLRTGGFNEYKCAFKALEYMACGLPVVTSAVGANAEVVIDGLTGNVCHSAMDWQAYLARLIDDPGARAKMGAAGRAKIEKTYDVSRLAGELEALLMSPGSI